MAARAGLLEMSTGSVLRLDGTDWTVAAVDACFGRVRLDPGGGDEQWRSIRWLAHHRDCGPARGRSQVTTIVARHNEAAV
jgi:hypothetical protein